MMPSTDEDPAGRRAGPGPPEHGPPEHGPRGRARGPGAAMSTLYLLATYPLAVLWFALSVAGFFLGVGTVVVWIGVPILAFTTLMWRGFAEADRLVLRGMLGVGIPPPYRTPPYRTPPDGNWLARARARAADPATWKDFLYFPLNFVLRTLWFVIVATLWGSVLGAWSLWYWYRFLPDERAPLLDVDGDPAVVIDSTRDGIYLALAGVVIAVVAPVVARTLARAHVAFCRALLGQSEEARLRARNVILEESRRRSVDDAAAERRRIERDLHDGTQQRLVSLAMDLGMAREKFGTEPGAARALVEQAHAEAKRALAELRDLVRGIHPAVLTDRGLDAALSALAGRSPVPVEVEVRLRERLDPALEAIAYFVVAESLTNVAKHSGATRARVLVERVGRYLVVEVGDNGRGGATVERGGGLAGLADRAAGVDGTVSVDSPPGGPTAVRLELPCES